MTFLRTIVDWQANQSINKLTQLGIRYYIRTIPISAESVEKHYGNTNENLSKLSVLEKNIRPVGFIFIYVQILIKCKIIPLTSAFLYCDR